MTQFPGGSRMKEEGAGPFSASRPALGIPRPGGRRDAGAGGGWGEQVTQAGRGQATNPHRLGLSGSSAELRGCALPRPVTSSASWGGGARAPGALGGGGVGGRAGEAAPPPGKQALPHILPASRLFPAPSQPEEGPRATPLPAPRRAEPAPRQEVGAEPRPR